MELRFLPQFVFFRGSQPQFLGVLLNNGLQLAIVLPPPDTRAGLISRKHGTAHMHFGNTP